MYFKFKRLSITYLSDESRCFHVTRNTKDIYYNNSLTSSHYQIERGLKRKANEQIQHWLPLLSISHDIM